MERLAIWYEIRYMVFRMRFIWNDNFTASISSIRHGRFIPSSYNWSLQTDRSKLFKIISPFNQINASIKAKNKAVNIKNIKVEFNSEKNIRTFFVGKANLINKRITSSYHSNSEKFTLLDR